MDQLTVESHSESMVIGRFYPKSTAALFKILTVTIFLYPCTVGIMKDIARVAFQGLSKFKDLINLSSSRETPTAMRVFDI